MKGVLIGLVLVYHTIGTVQGAVEESAGDHDPVGRGDVVG